METDNQPVDSRPDPTEPLPPSTSQPAAPSVTPPKKSHKKLLLILLLVMLLAAGVGAWLLTKNDSGSTESAATTPVTSAVPKKLAEPSIVAYASGDATKAPLKLYWKDLKSGNAHQVMELGANVYVSDSGVYKNKVFVITTAGDGSDSGPEIWYSKDSGKSYNKVFAGAASKDGVGPGITSAKFSSDGNRIVFGYLVAFAGNTVKELNLTTKKTTDLFTATAAGVFIEGYDQQAQKLYYFTGCYYCDGNTFNKLFVRDLTTGTESVVYDDASHIGVQSVFNKDFSKLLLVKGDNGEFLGAGKPFRVEEFDMATKASKLLLTSNEEANPLVGYRDDTQAAYYTKGGNIYDLNSQTTAIFEGTQTILEVYYLGKNQVVLRAGSYSSADFSLIKYSFSNKSVSTVLTGKEGTSIFGIVE